MQIHVMFNFPILSEIQAITFKNPFNFEFHVPLNLKFPPKRRTDDGS